MKTMMKFSDERITQGANPDEYIFKNGKNTIRFKLAEKHVRLGHYQYTVKAENGRINDTPNLDIFYYDCLQVISDKIDLYIKNNGTDKYSASCAVGYIDMVFDIYNSDIAFAESTIIEYLECFKN